MTNTVPVQARADDLSRYLGEVRRFPLLAEDEESDLARRYVADGDPEAARRLVGSHLRLVVKIAKGFRGYGLPLADLIAEGNIGLMRGLRRFDPDRGVRLSTYAAWWIRAEIQDYIMRSQSLVKMGTTATQKKLFFNLRRLKGRLGEFGDGDLALESTAAIAAALEVPTDEVVSMNRRLQASDQSLNAAVGFDMDAEWQDRLVDESPDPETILVERDEFDRRSALLERSLRELDERERDILRRRKLQDEPLTLEDLSRRYGVSRERIRQIEARAMEKLSKIMHRPAGMEMARA